MVSAWRNKERLNCCEISGYHSGVYGDSSFLECNAVSLRESSRRFETAYHLTLKMKVLRSSDTSGINHPMAQCHIAEVFNLQLNGYQHFRT